MPQLTAEYTTALVRGAITAAISFGTVTLATYQATGDWTDAIVAGGVAALTVLGARFGGEGAIDSNRAKGAS